MVVNTRKTIWFGCIAAAMLCISIPSFTWYQQHSKEQSLEKIRHGIGIEALQSMDKLLSQGDIGFDELSTFALDEDLSNHTRIHSIRKLAEQGDVGFPVLIEVLATTDLLDGNSRELASAATFELSRNGGITDDVIPLIFTAYTALPPWDESFRPAGLKDSEIVGLGGWYGCSRDSLIDDSWLAIYELGEKAVPFLTKIANGENQKPAQDASALIKEILTGEPDGYHQFWLMVRSEGN